MIEVGKQNFLKTRLVKNVKEEQVELTIVPLKKLNPGTRFRRPTGEHAYLVSADRDESCGNVNVFCYNLTNGCPYWWDGSTRVVPLASGAFPTEYRAPAPELPIKLRSFWMCAVEGGGPPTLRQYNQVTAIQEAERLAKLTGKPVHLLKTVNNVRMKPKLVEVVPALVWEKNYQC